MKHPVLHDPERTSPAGIDRSINQDDDSDHATEVAPEPPPRDPVSGADAWNKPGLVDSGAPRP